MKRHESNRRSDRVTDGVIPIIDEQDLRDMMLDLLDTKLDELARELIEVLTPKPTEPSLEVTMTVKDLAELLQVDPKSIYRWRDEGVLPKSLEIGGTVRWDRGVVRRWYAERLAAGGESGE